MTRCVQVVTAGLFLLWFAATVAGQFGRRSRWIRRGLLGWCLPEWRLFAPVPAEYDYHLVYRIESASTVDSTFSVIDERPPGRLRPVWNPAARRQKIARDLANTLVNASPATGSSLPAYGVLLGVASRPAAERAGDRMQFGVVRDSPAGLDLLFVSAWHPVPRDGS